MTPPLQPVPWGCCPNLERTWDELSMVAIHDQDFWLLAGFASAARPLDSVRITGQYDNMGSGYSLPSRVVTEGGAAGVRNPALLNRPVATSHRYSSCCCKAACLF